MMTNPSWNANTPWDSPVSTGAATQSQSQNHGWNQNYNSASAVAAQAAASMHPPPSVSSQHQFNQFNFGSNSYDSFRNQRTLPSPNMNHQFLGTNGLSTSGKYLQDFHSVQFCLISSNFV